MGITLDWGNMKYRKKVALLTTGVISAVALVLSGSVAASAADSGPNILHVVATAAPDAVQQAAAVPTVATGSIAIDAKISGVHYSVPVDPSNKITLSSDQGSISLGLPFADKAANAVVEKSGIVSYENGNGSTTVPAVLSDGSVQINTVIENRDAPTNYSYSVTAPGGGRLVQDGEQVGIFDGDGSLAGIIAAPWAKDANGTAVATRYMIEGNNLIQVVDHNQPGVAYPVIADPKATPLWWGLAIKLTNAETKKLRDNFTPAYFTNTFCYLAGPFAPACGFGVSLRLWT